MAARWREGKESIVTVSNLADVLTTLPSIPTADFSIEDIEAGNGSEEEELFCRSRYVEGMGGEERAPGSKENNSDSPLPAPCSRVQEGEASSCNSTKDDVGIYEEDDWEAFKEAFSTSEVPDNEEIDSASIREQLLMHALTYLGGVGSSAETSADGPKGVLTLNRLDAIEESELDKALENIHLEGRRQFIAGTSQHNEVHFAWSSIHTAGAEPALMNKLEELSYSDGNNVGPSGVEVALDTSTGPQWRLAKRPVENKQTVFLDLRSEQVNFGAHATAVSSSAQRLLALRGTQKQNSSSGSDTDENEKLWREQRTKLKTGTESPAKTSGRTAVPRPFLLKEVAEPSGSDDDLNVSPSSVGLFSCSNGSHLANTAWPGHHGTQGEDPQSPVGSREARGGNKEPSKSTHGASTTKCQSKREQRPRKKSKQKGKGEQKREDNCNRNNVQSNVKSKHAAPTDGGTSSASDGTASVSASVNDGTASVSDGTASVSDGTASVSDGTSSVSDGTSRVSDKMSCVSGDVCVDVSCVSNVKSTAQDEKSDSGSELKTGGCKSGSSKKKKSSKNKSNGSTKSSTNGSTKSHRRSERKQKLLSINSDEDTALPTVDKVDDSTKVVESPEDTRNHIRDYIRSKKPPATFETPATQPTFHEEASFGTVKLAVDPTQTTDGLLVMKLTEAGTYLQPAGTHLSSTAQTDLQCLLLSWLMTLAAPGEGEESGQSVLPVKVTGLLQTVINGSRCLAVGVALLPNQSHPERDVDVDAHQHVLERILTQVTFKEALKSTLVSVSKYLHSTTLEELEAVMALPLSALFTFEEDSSPLRAHISFYWHSLFTADSHQTADSLQSQAVLQTTVCAIPLEPLLPAELVFVVAQQAYRVGLDLAGTRLVYDQSAAALLEGNRVPLGEESDCDDLAPKVPILVLALRGPNAVHVWMDAIGSKDVTLARITDPSSINAKFGVPGRTLLECVRTPYLVSLATALCFGGRACTRTGSVLGMSDPATKSERRKRQRVRFSDSSESDEFSRSSSSSQDSPSPLLLPPLVSNLPALVVPPFRKFVLALSPQVSPLFYPTVLATCSRFGYDLLGVRRLRLNQKRAVAIGIPARCLASFTPTSSSPSTSPASSPKMAHVVNTLSEADQGPTPPLPSTFLLLGRENAPLHSSALMEALLSDLVATEKLLPSNSPSSFQSTVMHSLEYSDMVIGMLGGFSPLPPMINTQFPLPSQGWESSGYIEEICVVAATQSNGLGHALRFLDAVFGVHCDGSSSSSPESPQRGAQLGDTTELGGLELLGIKLVPQLSRYHAKQLCPLEPSSPFYQNALNALSDVPVLLLVLRGLQCNARIQRLIPELIHLASEPKVNLIASTSFQHAYNLLSVFFTDRELFCDFKERVLSPYVPCPSIDTILSGLQEPVQPLCSVFSVPASQGGLFIRVMEKLSRAGFKFVGMTCYYGDQKNGTVESGSGLLVVCVEHFNAVWHLKRQLEAFVRSATSAKPTLSYSSTYKEALSDIAKYFPKGIYCQSTLYHQLNHASEEENISLPVTIPLVPQSSSPFLESTVVVHCPSVAGGNYETELVRCLDLLLQAGFLVQGINMTWFSAAKARDILSVCPSQITVNDLTATPCLVLQLLRDNAASCFSAVFRRLLSKSDLCIEVKELDNLEKAMIVPKNASEVM